MKRLSRTVFSAHLEASQLALIDLQTLAKSGAPRTGHAARPGTGPKGETCGSCTLLREVHVSRKYFKCGHDNGRVSKSTSTDIRWRDPACEHWEGKQL